MAALDEDSCLKMFPQPRPTRQEGTKSVGLEDKEDDDKPQEEKEDEEEEEPEVVQKKSDDTREEHVPEIQPIEQVNQCLQKNNLQYFDVKSLKMNTL